MAKVSLTYKEKTVYRELSSDAIHSIDYRDVLKNDEKKDEFTHVVVGIEYGGTCTLFFERKIKDFETKENIEGALSAALNSFPASGEAGLKLNNDVKEKIGSFKCSVYSDLKLDACVTNLDEPLSLFKSLPKKLFPSGETYAQRGVQ